MARQATHRPQRASGASERRVVHRKRQPRLPVPAARGDDTARAQRVVEVGRVHLRALVRRACAQPGECMAHGAPRLRECAVARPILQIDRVEAVVQRSNVCCSGGRAQRRVVDALPAGTAAAGRTGAVHCRGLDSVRLAAAHLEAAVRDRALDEQARCLEGERLQEVHAVQARRAERRTRHLEVARAGEDDAAVHDVVVDDRV